MRSIVLYFGSFNPIHKGHIALATAALEETGAREVWFVLSPQNPFKTDKELWPESKRASLVLKAISGYSRLKFCNAELNLPKPSYTIQTLDFLQSVYPDTNFSILMGEDNLAALHLWKDYRSILNRCEIIVYPRSGTGEKTASASSGNIYPILEEFPDRIRFLNKPLLDISSSDIRQKIKEGKDISGLVPPETDIDSI